MSQHVLALQHSATEPLGILSDVLQNAGLHVLPVRGFDGKPVPQEMGSASGLIILGGPMSASEQARYPFLTDEMRLVERALECGLPVLGICLGSQILAHVLGGNVRRNAQLEIGWHDVTLTEAAPKDALFSGFPPIFTGFHWHGDIFGLPRDAMPLAYSELTPCQAFRHGENVYGIQFHMEVTDAIIGDWTADGAGELSEAGLTAEMILSGIAKHLPTQRRLGRQAFTRWTCLL